MQKIYKILFSLILISGMALAFVNISNADDLSSKLKGKILIQVEENGEAWYVNPKNGQRYFLGRPADAFNIMRELGLGVSNADFNKWNGVAPKNLSGMIVLKVQDKGQAYYVDPKDLKMYYLGRPADAFKVMREKGLGITNQNLETIKVSDLSQAPLGITPATQTGKIEKFDNYEQLQEFLVKNTSSEQNYRDGGIMTKELAAPSAAPNVSLGISEVSEGFSDSVSQDYSATNIQVAGIDEADIIKTDGKYIYAVDKNNVYIIDANPAASAKILSVIKFKDTPQDIYINGQVAGKAATRLVVFGNDYNIQTYKMYDSFRRQNNYTFFKVFDITDKVNPKMVRDLDLEGSYANSRMEGDWVYFVTNMYRFYYIEKEPVLPRILSNGAELSNACSGGLKCYQPEVYYFDIPYNNINYLTVNSINVMDDLQPIKGDIYLTESTQEMYMSLNNIYLTYTKYVSEYELFNDVKKEVVYPLLTQADKDKIANIENAESYILSNQEKKDKINNIIDNFIESQSKESQADLMKKINAALKAKYDKIADELQKTIIYKIAYDNGNLQYKTQGWVSGRVLNQFSMDEKDGNLRVATTRDQNWSFGPIEPMPLVVETAPDSSFIQTDVVEVMPRQSTESINNLFVLDQNLKLLGAVTGLAEGERIYSARFMQDRAYLVTFKQIDPLFVIGLEDPRNPKVLGYLKIPGYSSYLHPYDETTLIGFGMDTEGTEWGGVRTAGLKLSLFDVSDVSSPKEIDTEVIGGPGSGSDALYDHHAFLFSKEKNLISIPVELRDEKDSYGEFVFNGAIVFNVDKQGFTKKGQISHGDNLVKLNDDWQYEQNTKVKRSLYISNDLYTFSDNYLKMNQLNNLEYINQLNLLNNNFVNEEFEVVNKQTETPVPPTVQ